MAAQLMVTSHTGCEILRYVQTLSLLSPVDSILVVSVDALEARLIVHCEGLQLYLGQLLWPAGGHGGTHAVHGGQVLDIRI